MLESLRAAAARRAGGVGTGFRPHGQKDGSIRLYGELEVRYAGQGELLGSGSGR